ncbi:MAG: carbon storage regulator CsrA [Pirellulaceae bacterium]|nr:carbon storage regulator CsrA [Pirellulaceae bacterium]
MLVLSRKINEIIRIGRNIEVRVLETHGDRVKLGFIGPPEVAIHREEVYREIQKGSRRAAPV